MDFVELKKNGYRIVTNWQDCNKKTIFIFHSNNSSKFLSYKNLALKKNCKFIVCNFKFKNQDRSTLGVSIRCISECLQKDGEQCWSVVLSAAAL